MRQRSRAFIVAEESTPNNRIVFINSDVAMADTHIRREIVKQLSAAYPGVYSDKNVAFVATHSHAGVAGYVENLLPQITSYGYVKQSADAIIQGTVLAVKRAHASVAPGKLSVGTTTILDGNANRSPTSYLANPAAERARYSHDTDKDMTLLRFDDNSGNARGFLSFYAVHGTSLYNNNTLVSGDNKGMAAFLYENSVEPDAMPGRTTFVAGFTQTNMADTTPNTLGAYCENPAESYHGQPCDAATSTCGGKTQDCKGRGPGYRVSDFESSRIIGDLQFRGAQTIMNGARSAVSGPVRSTHAWIEMASYEFALPNGTQVSTCPAALGYSFAGGTTDGPGMFDFTQGSNVNPFWEVVKGALTPNPTAAEKACQAPKPILLNTGASHSPYEWAPNSVSAQMFRVGNFVMLIMPGEFTTMAGRRVREALRAKLVSSGVLSDSTGHVVMAGPANAYTHYVTTPQEYAIQRYEGASTIFGPFTLDAYIHKYSSMVPYLADNASGSPPSDTPPPDLIPSAISLATGVVWDSAPSGKSFGQVLQNAAASYSAGAKVSVQFVGAHPRNNMLLEGTYLTVDRLVSGAWATVKTDSHPSTTFEWVRVDGFTGTSTVTITWTIESGTPAGSYRIRYFGNNKVPVLGTIKSFTGTSATFTVA